MEKILVIAGHFENLSNLTKRLKDLLPESTLITPLFGPEGITLDSSLDPDLILIGPEDPVIYELCRNLKRDEWLQEVPLLFLLEGPGHLAAGLKALEAGANACLSISVGDEDLVLQIQALFNFRNANRTELGKERTTYVRDVNLNKQYEKKFEIDEEIFAQFLEHSPAYVFFKDDNIRTLRLSRNFENLIGRPMDDLLGKTMFELFSAESADQFLEADLKIIREGKKLEIEEEFNGRTFKTIKFPIQIGERRSLLAGISLDITEQKQAQEELRKSELNFAELNTTKDKFFSIISHDLRAPFNGILGFSNLLIDQIRKRDYEGLEEYAGIIQHSSKRAMELLSNLLEWSRSQTGSIRYDPTPIVISQVIGEIFASLNEMAYQKGITLTSLVSDDQRVYADRQILGSILRNLISNAIKFTYPSGEIVISANNLEWEMLISIKDDGVGIKDEVVSKLFRIEESFSLSGTNNEKGTGLGLIMCREFVEKHGGRIWVEPNMDHLQQHQGSIFKFTLPNAMVP